MPVTLVHRLRLGIKWRAPLIGESNVDQRQEERNNEAKSGGSQADLAHSMPQSKPPPLISDYWHCHTSYCGVNPEHTRIRAMS